MLVGHVGNRLEIQHVVLGVGHRFDVDGPRVRLHGPGNALRIGGVDEGDLDPQPLEGLGEERNRAAVEGRRGNNVRTRVGQVQQGDGDRLLPAGEGQGPDAAFQGGHPLLEDVGRGVHQPRVDPAHLLQREQVRRMFRALENVARGLVDRHRTGTGGGVGLLPGMQCKRAKAKGTGGVS